MHPVCCQPRLEQSVLGLLHSFHVESLQHLSPDQQQSVCTPQDLPHRTLSPHRLAQ